jgi:hypothetical protein
VDLMSDYNQTRTVSGEVVSRFANLLRNLEDDFEEEIVVNCLVKYHRMCSKSDEDLLWAIERILQDFMTPDQYSGWSKNK